MPLESYLTLTPDHAVELRRQRVRDLEVQHYRLQLAAEEVGSSAGVADEQAQLEAAIAVHVAVLEPPAPPTPKKRGRRAGAGRKTTPPIEGPAVTESPGAPLSVSETSAGDTDPGTR